jgi:hypothetical protein
MNNIGTVFTVIAVGLLVVAANLDSPSVWILAPAWIILAVRVWVWFEDNKVNERKVAPVVLTFVLAIVIGLASQKFQTNILTFLKSPTLDNLGKLTSSSPFLFLAACYFAISLLTTKGKLHEAEDKYEELKKIRLEEIALHQNELKSLKEKLLAELNKSSSN